MSTSNYEGPRGGDYARYVDELLRASPLHQSLGQVLREASRSDFTGEVLSPGDQPGSVLTRVRERAQAAMAQAQKQAQQQAIAECEASGQRYIRITRMIEVRSHA